MKENPCCIDLEEELVETESCSYENPIVVNSTVQVRHERFCCVALNQKDSNLNVKRQGNY